MTFATISEAIDWTREHWHAQRPVPIRIHSHETEGIGLFYAPAFAAAMDGSPYAKTEIETSESCGHWRRVGSALCLDCAIFDETGKPIAETGVYKKRSVRFVYPMSAALTTVRNSLRPARQPHPYRLIVEIASHDWDWRAAARANARPLDIAEALYLQALRRLSGHYQDRPSLSRRDVTRTWVDLSDSQRNAIEAGETAA
jgi:hypothetical protein